MRKKYEIEETEQVWNRFIPVSYDTAISMLKRDLPDDLRIDITLSEDGKGDLDIDGHQGLVTDERSFDFNTGIVGKGHMRINSRIRDNGIGRKLMRNQIEFFHLCGMKKYEINAADSAGGYCWARFGFLPTDFHAMDMMRSRYSALAPLLPARESSKLLSAIEKKDVWSLSDMRQDVSGKLSSLFNEEANRILFNTYMVQEATSGHNVPLGKAMLAGAYWEGVLDFNNAAQMKRASDYVGGLTLLRDKKTKTPSSRAPYA